MFQKLESFTNKVSQLADKPTLSPTELKAQFDAAPDEVRQYLNQLIDDLNIEFPNYAKKQQEAWIPAVLQNGWTSVYPLTYYKDDLSIVRFTGEISNGNKAYGTVIFTLPTGYRPSIPCRFTVVTWDDTTSFAETDVLVSPNGNVTVGFNSAKTYLSLNLSFRAEQ